jgi:hypothetical protein
MKNVISISVVMVVMCTAPSAVGAQEDGLHQTSVAAVEITPHVSVGSAASSGFGAAIRWSLGANLSIEGETGQRRGEVNALGANVSLLFDLPGIGRVTPYVASGVGLDQYGYAVGSPQGGLVTQAGTALTVNAGGGIRVPIDNKWGVRTDARWFNGVGKKSPERWRVYNGVTFGPGRR